MVRPDYCAVDHLQAGVAAAAVVESFEQKLPQAGQCPAPKLTVNRRPFAKMFMQVAPRNAGAGNPENPIENEAVVPWATPAARPSFDHERFKPRPFLVAHQTPDQGSLPNSHLESDAQPLGNPLCQHDLSRGQFPENSLSIRNFLEGRILLRCASAFDIRSQPNAYPADRGNCEYGIGRQSVLMTPPTPNIAATISLSRA